MSQKRNWDVQQLRCTAFPSQGAEYDPSHWWRDVIGSDPSEIVQKPSERIYKAKGESPFDGALELKIEPIRFEWRLEAQLAQGDSPTSDFPVLGDLRVLEQFSTLSQQWLPLAPSLTRLAFGAIFLLPLEDRMSGYRHMAELLRNVSFDPETARDLLYQINKRRGSRCIANLQINRLSKWSCIAFQQIAIHSQGRAGEDLMINPYRSEPNYFIRLELDINTAPEHLDILPSDNLGPLFKEFVEFAIEISEKGDIE